MLVEQRIYTLIPGKVETYFRNYAEVGNDIQEPTLGRFLGYYTTEVGPLNRVIHMWAYRSPGERSRRRAIQNADPRWIEYSTQARTLITSQENRLLKPDAATLRALEIWFPSDVDQPRPEGAQAGSAPLVLEMETLVVRPEHQGVAQALLDHSSACETAVLGNRVGRYVSLTGTSHQFITLWAYDDFDDCFARRAALAAQPDWQRFNAEMLPMTVSRDLQLLRPIPFWQPRLRALLAHAAPDL